MLALVCCFHPCLYCYAGPVDLKWAYFDINTLSCDAACDRMYPGWKAVSAGNDDFRVCASYLQLPGTNDDQWITGWRQLLAARRQGVSFCCACPVRLRCGFDEFDMHDVARAT